MSWTPVCLFHDSELGFTLDSCGLPDMDVLSQKYAQAVPYLLGELERTERCEIVNVTAHPHESEARAADHFARRRPAAACGTAHQPTLPAAPAVPSTMPSQIPADGAPPPEAPSLEASLAEWADVRRRVCGACEAAGIRDVIVNGIGGSMRGPRLLVDALREAPRPGALRLHWLDNTDPEQFVRVIGALDPRQTLMLTLSKSGETAEPMGNLHAWLAVLSGASVAPGPHNLAVTQPGTRLARVAAEHAFAAVFSMSPETGGRTSVCSPVGMAVMALAGIDAGAFVQGMAAMDARHRVPRSGHTDVPAVLACAPALAAAVLIHDALVAGHRGTCAVLAYAARLQRLSPFLRQLYMESLGKAYMRGAGAIPCASGLTVFGGVGTGEQHAMLQQLVAGPYDTLVRFVSLATARADVALPPPAASMRCQLAAFLHGTQRALARARRPYLAVRLSACTPHTMGALLAFEERVVAYLALLLHVNAYDQPGVQAGKLAAGAWLVHRAALPERLAHTLALVNGAPPQPVTVAGLAAALAAPSPSAPSPGAPDAWMVHDLLRDLAACSGASVGSAWLSVSAVPLSHTPAAVEDAVFAVALGPVPE